MYQLPTNAYGTGDPTARYAVLTYAPGPAYPDRGTSLFATTALAPEPAVRSGQTLDRVIASGRLDVPAAEPAEALLGDRRDISAMAVIDLLDVVRHRYLLYHRHWHMLEEAKVAASNALGIPSIPPPFVSLETREKLHGMVNECYQQQREERLSLWRDLVQLRQALPEAIQAYVGAFRKSEILRDGDGGGSL